MFRNKTLLFFILSFGLFSFMLAQQNVLVIEERFNNYPGANRTYTESMMKADWGNTNGPYKGLLGLTKVGDGVIQGAYPKGSLLAYESGFSWFNKLPNNGTEEAVMEYRLKFSKGYDWTKGGKLPGLCGGKAPRGCTQDTLNRNNGFSARLMWHRNGMMIVYPYWTEMPGRCGSAWYFEDESGNRLKMETGRWYTVRQHIKMNTYGQHDGVSELFLDGVLVQKKTDILWRLPGRTFNIDKAYLTTYVGGSTDEFRPTRDNYIWFDDFRVWMDCETPENPAGPVQRIPGKIQGESLERGSTVSIIDVEGDANEKAVKLMEGNEVEYDLDVLLSDTFALQLRILPSTEKVSLKLSMESVVIDTIEINGTEDFISWITHLDTLVLDKGKKTLKLEVLRGTCMLNWMDFINNTEIPHLEMSMIKPVGDITVKEGYKLDVDVSAASDAGAISEVMMLIDGKEIRAEKVTPYTWGHSTSPNPNELNALPIGEHSITFIGKDDMGNSGKTGFTLTVEPLSNSIEDAVVSHLFTIYPNPSNGQFTIDLSTTVADVYIYNVAGELIFEQLAVSGQLNLSKNKKFKGGTYFVSVRGKNKARTIKKMILY